MVQGKSTRTCSSPITGPGSLMLLTKTRIYGSATTAEVQNGCVAQSLSKRSRSCEVKVNDQTWKRHVEQLRHSTLSSPEMETIDDCAVPEEVQHGMPLVVMETEWKNLPPLAATPIGEFSPSEQQGHQQDPRPGLITTRAGRVVKPPPRLKDCVCD